MSDIELPDTRHSDLGIDLEKGIFLRRPQQQQQRGNIGPATAATADSDSGNNSLNTNRSNCSTGTSSSSKASGPPVESSFMEEDEDDYAENVKMSPEIRITKPQINKNIIEVRYRGRELQRKYFTFLYCTALCTGSGEDQKMHGSMAKAIMGLLSAFYQKTREIIFNLKIPLKRCTLSDNI